jgi:uracil-DNA glycosylase
MQKLLSEISACRVCAEHFNGYEPRPVVHLSAKSKILIIGQAPGTRVHKTGIPWNDPSGDQLRAWLQVSKEEFYNTDNFAIMPMGFCYPGKGTSGDLPPRLECAPLWHEKLLAQMPHIQLTLLIGQYAQKYYLGERFKKNLTETVRSYGEFAPQFFPLPHPSPRNRLWIKKNAFFERDCLPQFKHTVQAIIS